MLTLPDRNGLLNEFDQPLARREGLGPMGCGGGCHERDIPDNEQAFAVCRGNRDSRLGLDRRAALLEKFGGLGMRTILQSAYRESVIVIANDPTEGHDRPVDR